MKRKKIIPNMNIEIPQEYRQSLVPYPKEMLELMNLPEETFAFLTQVGLPRRASCEITPNVPLKFFEAPYVQPHAHLQNTFLYVGSMESMGLIAIDVKNQGVFQIQEIENDLWVPWVMNDSIKGFVECLGLWLSFYPQLREEVGRQLAQDQSFSLFDHEELYQPVLQKLKEADPKGLREYKFFWRRMCQPDIV